MQVQAARRLLVGLKYEGAADEDRPLPLRNGGRDPEGDAILSAVPRLTSSSLPDLANRTDAASRLDEQIGEPEFGSQPLKTFDVVLRRLRDVVLAVLGLFFLLPLLLIIAIAIKYDSAGPVLFLQDRVGRNGRYFKMLKFRSMHVDASSHQGPSWTTGKRDPRITRVGALIRGFHFDELPQLVNVIKGDMSLVGPRPFHPLHCAQLEASPHFRLRLLVLPGLTGWAQVRCDYSDSVDNYEEVLARDLYYMKHRNLMFDLLIIFETLRICLWRRGSH